MTLVTEGLRDTSQTRYTHNSNHKPNSTPSYNSMFHNVSYNDRNRYNL